LVVRPLMRSAASPAGKQRAHHLVLTSETITETDILNGRWDNAAVEVWWVKRQAVG
jgi:hypothetical protein